MHTNFLIMITISLLLRKVVYPYQYMDDWEKLNGTLPEKENFYSQLNVEDITDVDYVHAKKVCKDFEIKKIMRISTFVCSKQDIVVS